CWGLQVGQLTRRSLLGGALAGGGALLVPRATRALAGQPDGDVFTLALRGPGPLRTPRAFDMVGVEWDAPEPVHIELRARTRRSNLYAGGQSAAIVRSICLFHRNVHGWNDIGYNFLVDRYGQIFEGRGGGIDEPLAGAQAGGYNLSSTGVAVIGTFDFGLP